jgi:hypothetical protein
MSATTLAKNHGRTISADVLGKIKFRVYYLYTNTSFLARRLHFLPAPYRRRKFFEKSQTI